MEKKYGEIQKLRKLLEKASEKIESMKPKAQYYDIVLSSKKGIRMSVIAKEFGKSASEMHSILHSLGIIYKTDKAWVLYAKYQDLGYQISHTTYNSQIEYLWTQKGRKFIHDAMDGKKEFLNKPIKSHQITMEEVLNNEI
ncbi:phage antirepressor KilAC domain-containing protein [Viridibacillus arvi]|uniref:phage antirepressor KilAC domain-containing protein n=1 Tax=Viridibacillus arvi TaxID=263475 RepID=UPI0006A95DD0|nr:phage antirepressor KilAC domain-containing protein [Viridibacillus arvi]